MSHHISNEEYIDLLKSKIEILSKRAEHDRARIVQLETDLAQASSTASTFLVPKSILEQHQQEIASLKQQLQTVIVQSHSSEKKCCDLTNELNASKIERDTIIQRNLSELDALKQNHQNELELSKSNIALLVTKLNTTRKERDAVIERNAGETNALNQRHQEELDLSKSDVMLLIAKLNSVKRERDALKKELNSTTLTSPSPITKKRKSEETPNSSPAPTEHFSLLNCLVIGCGMGGTKKRKSDAFNTGGGGACSKAVPVFKVQCDRCKDWLQIPSPGDEFVVPGKEYRCKQCDKMETAPAVRIVEMVMPQYKTLSEGDKNAIAEGIRIFLDERVAQKSTGCIVEVVAEDGSTLDHHGCPVQHGIPEICLAEFKDWLKSELLRCFPLFFKKV
ncbi:UNVERIFIED_CONTAM: hypothetical protein HDU68_007495 [Siphonaria sp. JEL0065]|nr:hypothetical protein HDU68_007495 [Siphonaria sp. JEL0065]